MHVGTARMTVCSEISQAKLKFWETEYDEIYKEKHLGGQLRALNMWLIFACTLEKCN